MEAWSENAHDNPSEYTAWKHCKKIRCTEALLNQTAFFTLLPGKFET